MIQSISLMTLFLNLYLAQNLLEKSMGPAYWPNIYFFKSILAIFWPDAMPGRSCLDLFLRRTIYSEQVRFDQRPPQAPSTQSDPTGRRSWGRPPGSRGLAPYRHQHRTLVSTDHSSSLLTVIPTGTPLP